MPAGVVDQLELVEVQVHQGMPLMLMRRTLQRPIQAEFELVAIGQPGEGVVGGLPGQPLHVLALAGHVVEHQHGASDAGARTNRRDHQVHRHPTAIATLDQLGGFAATVGLAAQDPPDQDKFLALGVITQQTEQRG
ncbi:hypothetical protein D3C81_1221780 [compost metagenome]